MNKRDALIALAALAATPFGGRAQQPGKVWRIGFLGLGSGPGEFIAAFRDELRTLGYVEGSNVSIEFRWPAGREDRLTQMAAELVALKVDVIVTQAMQPVVVAKRATSTIPIVMTAPSDAVGGGLVASLARPGGNVTGMTMLSIELAGKRLQLIREVVPKATRVGVLVFKGGLPTPAYLEQIRIAAKQMGVTPLVREENEAASLPGAFAALQRERAQALIVQQTPFFNENRQRIIELAAQFRLPAIFESRDIVNEGGLISYGSNIGAMYRRAAYYVDRIFKGAKPADLPVEQPTIFEMALNLKTAKALGLTIPQTVMLQAVEVIK